MRSSALLLLAVLARPALGADAKAGTRLVSVSGDVTIQSKDGGRLGKNGAALAEGDSVSTAENSTALVELPDGSRLKLRASSRLAVTLPTKKSRVTEVFLSFGSAFAKVTKRLAGEEFHVRTPSAVAAVRGTEFFTAFGRADGAKKPDLWVCVNEGAVDLSTTKSARVLRVPAGQGVLIAQGLDLNEPRAYDWTKTLNWNMDEAKGALEDKTNLDAAYDKMGGTDKPYKDLLDQDYR